MILRKRWIALLLIGTAMLAGCSRKEKNEASDTLILAEEIQEKYDPEPAVYAKGEEPGTGYALTNAVKPETGYALANEVKPETGYASANEPRPETGYAPANEPRPEHKTCVWGEGIVERESTCRVEGVMLFTCTVCGEQKREAIPVIPHNMEIGWYGKPATCTRGGYQVLVCTGCGLVDESVCGSVPPLEHELEAVKLQQGNCQEDTIIEYCCTRCGQQIGYDRYRETGLHDWVWKEVTVWDENQFSFIRKKIRVCSRCGAALAEELS